MISILFISYYKKFVPNTLNTINTCSLFYSILGSYEKVVEMLISCLIQNGNDGFFEGDVSSAQNNLDNLMTINMIIATLQKLSLK